MGRPRLNKIQPATGRIKVEPEDFIVEEIPSYEPVGEGTHWFFWIEKRGLTTRRAVAMLAAKLGVRARDIGTAGLKDRHALTRQYLSAEHVDGAALSGWEQDGLRVLRAVPHRSKLRTGHLRGNRFSIRVRAIAPAEAARLAEEGTALASGVPNYYGDQRFGRDGSNVDEAREWLAEGGRPPKERFKRRFLVSALQSAAFNAVLAARVERGCVHQAMAGDVLMTARGGIFEDDDLEAVQRRMDAGEIDPTGPMFGGDMRRAQGLAGALESSVEDAFGFGPTMYARMGKLGLGTRRALRIRPAALKLMARRSRSASPRE
ncbi:MAG: tRNA pseudouridine(13) synthase TruD [Myxococcota bacterium]